MRAGWARECVLDEDGKRGDVGRVFIFHRAHLAGGSLGRGMLQIWPHTEGSGSRDRKSMMVERKFRVCER